MINENENKNDLNTTQEINPQPVATDSQTVVPSPPTPTLLERIKSKKYTLVA